MTSIEFPDLTPAEILATEEVLLDAAEAGTIGETLAFWESPAHFVVLGYGNKVATETNQPACERLGIPILRRISGGGTVLQGPGVLNYSLVLRAEHNTPLASINGANRFIMERNAEALTRALFPERGCPSRSAPVCQPTASVNSKGSVSIPHAAAETAALRIEVQGHTDLAIAGRKFSGNAQRRKRTHLLFHGAILLNLDLDLLDQVLPMPSLQPDYRDGRSHRHFLTQLSVPAEVVKQSLREAWLANEHASLDLILNGWRTPVEKLVADRYSRADWNIRT